jgi:hypothetical protein
MMTLIAPLTTLARKRRGVAESRTLEQGGRVVDDRVDPGDLLEHGQQDPHHQQRADLWGEEFAHTGPAPAEPTHLGDLGLDVTGLADPAEHGPGFVFPAPGDEPCRAFLLEQHAGEQQDGRDRGQTEHQPPVLAGREPVVDQVRDQDPAGDGQLVEADKPTAEPGRHHLADIQGHDHRR